MPGASPVDGRAACSRRAGLHGAGRCVQCRASRYADHAGHGLEGHGPYPRDVDRAGGSVHHDRDGRRACQARSDRGRNVGRLGEVQAGRAQAHEQENNPGRCRCAGAGRACRANAVYRERRHARRRAVHGPHRLVHGTPSQVAGARRAERGRNTLAGDRRAREAGFSPRRSPSDAQ